MFAILTSSFLCEKTEKTSLDPLYTLIVNLSALRVDCVFEAVNVDAEC